MTPRLTLALCAVLVLGACARGDAPDSLTPGLSAPGLSTSGSGPESAAPSRLRLTEISYESIPGWGEDRLGDALAPFLAACARWRLLPLDRRLDAGFRAGTVADWVPACEEAKQIPPDDANRVRYFFESFFSPVRMTDTGGGRTGLVTGYYEAALRGAWRRGGPYQTPILSRPSDIVSVDLSRWRPEWRGEQIAGRLDGSAFIPYPTRAEIETGALSGRQLEILYVDNLVDAFVMHIQGSGRVEMDDGGVVRLGYAGRNGHPYTAVGRELVALGAMDLGDVTMPAIRAWLEDNPAAADEIMRRNRSYIFFRVNSEPGPVGAMGAALTPGRSIAVDPAFTPLGAPVFLSTRHPLTDEPLRRLMIAHDTGAAIKGPLRADFFWGHGREAADAAGTMRGQGSFIMLLPKSAAAGVRAYDPRTN
ncbi:MAG: murein transglycosylase A [Rhodospirillales bacterium]